MRKIPHQKLIDEMQATHVHEMEAAKRDTQQYQRYWTEEQTRAIKLEKLLDETRSREIELMRDVNSLHNELHVLRGTIVEYALAQANPLTAADTKRLLDLQRRMAGTGDRPEQGLVSHGMPGPSVSDQFFRT